MAADTLNTNTEQRFHSRFLGARFLEPAHAGSYNGNSSRRPGFACPAAELQGTQLRMFDDETLQSGFQEAFPDAPEPRICRAPGRINLLGEHIDYSGLPVLPMAINRDIRIAYAPRKDSLVRMRNDDPAFPETDFENQADIPHSPWGTWDNYCKAAIQGVNQHFQMEKFVGMDLYVGGDIPSAAGLSSSSAMVVASSLAYLDAAGCPLGDAISRIELANLLAEAEHFVGTRGGGMDQAIILLGEKDSACKINFHPLRAEPLPLLEGYVVVACDSMVKAEKTGNMRHRYNEGPLTCRVLCELVEKAAREEFDDEIRIQRLGDLWHGDLCLTDKEAEDLFEKAIPADAMSVEETARFLGTTEEDLRARCLGDLQLPPEGLRLKARARHQITEQARVEEARDMLLAGDAEGFGELMNASHESCAQDYLVSCPELDDLVEIARDCGAVGARMTGAGFGGCTVNLVPEELAETFMRAVARDYYRARFGETASLDDAIIPVQSAAGAGYVQ
jgi:N-acetylgalactosamine kinase